ncbi:bacterial alpha-L-rhamnosidase 6 hairpin glycosidase domain-containing protein [Hirsutella rhossiliensis]|uniref:alpha-L-rhamnosidase n=1 Tax=Hirsutella rhossiliensis TaxID=111463 RepID=A0A9P8N1Q0_9HYPO|nr:bacterial alpha-L-rhamnosidase 6 hairpin glycosidase domain-containing protein [Hirsutella rhossiliensis]KAH0966593.1 bacterial alpha-L-rhamnosidase 6 hairpin glycosidase domain-containing protein [Hirsutella rhossiliensis]
MAVSISQLAFEHHRVALGIAETKPRISWRFSGHARNWVQSSYDIQISRDGHAHASASCYSTASSQSMYVPWPSEPLKATERAKVRARAYGNNGQSPTPWSDWVTVEAGLLTIEDWAGAVPVAADRETEVDGPKKPIYFRKSFLAGHDIESARLYITALGLYEAEINGKRVGDAVLSPGWQSFNYRHVYDTYDVTALIKDGDNAIGVSIGEGWFAGRISFLEKRNLWGDTLGVQSLLIVTLKNGSTIKVPTDESWKANTGPIVQSEIYNGESYDSRWLAVKKLSPLKGKLVPADGPPVRKLEERKPERIFKSASGKTLIDLGQNMVGWLRLNNVEGPSGTTITLRHAEVLENEELALKALRSAKATDTFILNGNGKQTWEPHFTFHGFRFAQIDGWPKDQPLSQDSITGIVVHSDLEQTGWFECSHQLLNQLHSNRAERLGWTGDAHVFGPTANFLYNTAGFWRGWHKDMYSEMQRQGSMRVPWFVPTVPPDSNNPPGAVWGDVSVGGPWNLFQAFGDVGMLKEQYPQSKGWIDKGIPRQADRLWDRSGHQFADWLDPKAPPEDPGAATTAKYLVADAYLVRMTELLASMSTVLGDKAGAAEYRKQHADLRTKFQQAWIKDGQMTNRTQTAYALALEFGLYTDDKQRCAAADTLRDIVSKNDYLVGTGLAGTPALGPALRDIGAADDFYKMLLQTKAPSWLYQVVQNGTTTWERWDSLLPDGHVNTDSMTSFNHYAFGAVADWIHRTIGGLAPAEPGWRIVSVEPVPGGGITRADTKYISGYGEVRAKWQVDGGKFKLQVWVPPNARARVKMPKSGKVKEVGSGFYEFQEAGHYYGRL